VRENETTFENRAETVVEITHSTGTGVAPGSLG